nr:MAG TPA: hypothetical protein [Caudoviricetes sp.]
MKPWGKPCGFFNRRGGCLLYAGIAFAYASPQVVRGAFL